MSSGCCFIGPADACPPDERLLESCLLASLACLVQCVGQGSRHVCLHTPDSACHLRLRHVAASLPVVTALPVAVCLLLPARRFAVAEGDLISYLNVWRAWEESGRSKKWAIANHVMHRTMLRAADIRSQVCIMWGDGTAALRVPETVGWHAGVAGGQLL